MKRRTLLLCLPALAAPASVLALVPPARAVELGDMIDGREVWCICETCNRPLFRGDMVFDYFDGPAFCEAHAPTWADIKNEQDELIAANEFGDLFEDAERATRARNNVLAKIAAGRGEERVTWRL